MVQPSDRRRTGARSRRGTAWRAGLFAAIAVTTVSGGCAVNPVTGRPELTFVSESRERELGDEEARRIAETIGILDDAALATYVGAVGERLAAGSPRTDVVYRFAVLDMKEPNAFALPGGYVYVSRGLLALLNGEDELAGVLGHEIGHVAARHAVRRVTRAAPIAVLTGLGAAVTGIVSPTVGDVVGGIGGAAGALMLAPYSRGQEDEADRIGQELAAKAGWDPAGLSRALRALEREDATHGDTPRPSSFFATHPPLPERAANTEAYAATLHPAAATSVATSHTDFLRKLDGLPVGPRAAEGIFDDETFLHPDLGFHVRFPSGWKTANARTIVGASAPDGHAVIGLESVGEGDDPMATFRAFEQEAKADLSRNAERMTVGGLPAVRARALAETDDGRVALDMTWIAYAGRVYRITGITQPSSAETDRTTFGATVESFGPITDAERAGIREAKLRLVAARAGETVGDMVGRTDGVWKAEMAAAANAVETGDRLSAGRLVKLAILQKYRGGGKAASK
jgi:predicted Zn-dependent protease